jgi:hypothetical protein
MIVIRIFFAVKYYLVDAGYPHMKGYMGPYKGERYHLLDFRRGSQSRVMHEIFNYAHSSLRCTIEITFEVWKNKWKLLYCMLNFPYDKQVKIVVTSMTLHNFIRKHVIKNVEFQPYDDEKDLLLIDSICNDKAQNESSIQRSETSNQNSMNIERDHIVNLLMTR